MKPTKKEMVSDIKKTAEKVDGYLTLEKYVEHGKYGYTPVNSFDTWRNAKEQAGLTTRAGKKEQRLKKIEELVNQNKSVKEIQEETGLKSRQYTSNNIREAGYEKRRYIKASTHPQLNHKRAVFNFDLKLLEDAGIPNDDGTYFFEVETDEENNKLILNFKENRYRKVEK